MATTAGTTTVCAEFQQTAARHADAPALRAPDGRTWSWRDYARDVRAAAAALAGLGLRRGDVSACWLANRPEFHVADAAAMHLGVTSFSVYGTFTGPQAEHVLADAGARVLITEAAHVEEAIAIRERGATRLEHIVCLDGDAPEALGWDELRGFAVEDFDFEAAWHAVAAEDVATLIYTSGTTGPPKGVELTHANITAQTHALAERLRFPDGTRAVSFLPMAHIAERLCTHYFPMFGGWHVTCCPDARRVGEALVAARPGFFFSPPRLWEKLRAALLAGAGDDERAAVTAAVERVRAGAGPQDDGWQRAARARVGLDEVEVAIVGAAPCPESLIEFWHACGLPLSELYGMSETTGVATVAAPDAIRIGTVGPPRPVCDVRIGDGGEVLMRGPVVMRGYRNQPERTAETIDAGGWLHSGDVGSLDDDGHLRIVDRIKELIVSSAGKNMSPANIEATIRSGAVLIGQVCVLGDGRPYNVALLTLEPDAVRPFAAQLGVEGDLRRLARSRRVLEAVCAEVAAGNQRLARVEQVKRFLVLGEEWLPGGDELTPTMKLKRREIVLKYAEEIDALYAQATGMEVAQVRHLAREGTPAGRLDRPDV